jgi:hypothetical protein
VRLSIWQQFSSNHSAAFTVIGIFETGETAQQVAAEFRGILQHFVDWYEEPANERIRDEVLESLDHAPVPPELEMAERYDIKWPKAIDWLANIGKKHVERAVSVYENVVFVCNGAETNDGEIPFDGVMRHFTPNVVVQVEAAQSADIVLSCVAPNQAVATQINAAVSAYFQAPDKELIPWIHDHPDNVPKRDLTELVKRYNATREKRESHIPRADLMYFDLVKAEIAGDKARVEALREQIHLYEERRGLTRVDEYLIMRAEVDLYGQGEIHVEGLRLSFRVWLGRPARGLPVLIAYLANQGCSEIAYQFVQV